MRIFTKLTLAVAILAVLASPGAFGDTFCVPPKPAPSPPPAEPPCPACEPKECDKCTKSPVYVGSGSFVHDEADLSIRTTGFGIIVERHYDSSRAIDGPMGIGWTTSLTPRLHYAAYAVGPSIVQHRAYIVMPHGALYEFTSPSPGVFTPPIGRRDSLARNADGTFDLRLEHSRDVLRFNADGGLASMTDQFGNAIMYSYDANGRVQRISDAAGSGRYVDVTWNSSGRIDAITDSGGRVVRYTFDSAGTLTGVRDPATPAGEHARSYSYVQGRLAPLLSLITDRWSRVIKRIEWDSIDRVMSYTDGDFNDANPQASAGEKYTYEYFPAGVPPNVPPFTRKRDSLGWRDYTYTSIGLVTNDNTEYDGEGKPTATYDDDGRRTTYQYDTLGRVVVEKMHDSYGTVTLQWTTTYDSTFPDKISTRRSNKPDQWAGTRYVYYQAGDPAPGALKEVYQHRTDGVTEDRVAAYTWDSRGRLLSAQQTVDQPTTLYEYYANGDLKKVTQPYDTMIYEYDALGRVIKATDAMGSETTHTYDALDRITAVALPKPSATSQLDFTTTYVYDEYDTASGLTFTTMTDPNGNTTNTGYDALGNVRRSVDAPGNSTEYGYQYNLLTSVTDANGNRTEYAYDNRRQLRSTTFPDGQTETYSYGPRGRLNGMTDRKGTNSTYSYDEYGRLLSMAFPNNRWPGGATRGYSYAYEGQKLVRITNDMIETHPSRQFTYDSLFRVATERYAGDATISYDYKFEPGVTLNSYTISPPAQTNDPTTTVYYTWLGGRVRSVSFTPLINPDVTFDYNARGQYSQILFANGFQRDYTYDGQGRLTSVANVHSATGNVAIYDYGYDRDWNTGTNTLLGQRTRMSVAARSEAQQWTGTTKYRYDNNYQLVQVDEPVGAWTRWQYDAVGNRVSQESLNGPVISYEYYKYNGNVSNSSRLKHVAGFSGDYTYDANGNSLRGGAVWDLLNRLVSYGTSTYEYEAATGRRVKKDNIGYVYHGHDVAREKNATTGLVTDYLFGPGIDEPLVARSEAGVKTYFAVDGLGSIVAGVDSTGAVLQSQAYNAWGNVTKGGTSYSFGFTGREPGPASLLYYRARYYEPATGRFITEDPIGFAAGVNLYTYVANSPARYRDPTGLDREGCDGVPWCLETPRTLNCCYEHDQCFRRNNCSAWSWITNWPPPCVLCNVRVTCCFTGVCSEPPAPPDWVRRARENDPPPVQPRPPTFIPPPVVNSPPGHRGWWGG